MPGSSFLLLLSLLSIAIALSKESIDIEANYLSSDDDLSATDFQKLIKLKRAMGPQKDYYKSYSHYSSHFSMLSDQPRTDAYYTACLDNNAMLRDKIVLDVGCGTGILSFFAAWAGAKHVYCVENADIAFFVIFTYS